MQIGEKWQSITGKIKTIQEIDFVPDWKGHKIYRMTDGTVYKRSDLKGWKEIK